MTPAPAEGAAPVDHRGTEQGRRLAVSKLNIVKNIGEDTVYFEHITPLSFWYFGEQRTHNVHAALSGIRGHALLAVREVLEFL